MSKIDDSAIVARFLAKLNKTDSCWLWIGGTSRGYGKVRIKGKLYQAHVASWLIHRGDIPFGKNVLHNCPGGDVRACCNPDHLWLGSQSENILDAVAKGTHHKTKMRL